MAKEKVQKKDDFLKSSPEDMLINSLRERGRKGERAGEKHQSVASHMHPNQGPNLQPKHVS